MKCSVGQCIVGQCSAVECGGVVVEGVVRGIGIKQCIELLSSYQMGLAYLFHIKWDPAC